MQISAFNAKSPFEIGDRIQLARDGSIKTITDIAVTHFVKSGRIEFGYELDNSGEYVGLEAKKIAEEARNERDE
jgi:hypothetical protein